MANNIAAQLVKRIAYRKAMKRAIQTSMRAGAVGVKICVSGRLGGLKLRGMNRLKKGVFHCRPFGLISVMQRRLRKQLMASLVLRYGYIVVMFLKKIRLTVALSDWRDYNVQAPDRKYRKDMKGRNRGLAKNPRVCFGDYGLQAIDVPA